MDNDGEKPSYLITRLANSVIWSDHSGQQTGQQMLIVDTTLVDNGWKCFIMINSGHDEALRSTINEALINRCLL